MHLQPRSVDSPTVAHTAVQPAHLLAPSSTRNQTPARQPAHTPSPASVRRQHATRDALVSVHLLAGTRSAPARPVPLVRLGSPTRLAPVALAALRPCSRPARPPSLVVSCTARDARQPPHPETTPADDARRTRPTRALVRAQPAPGPDRARKDCREAGNDGTRRASLVPEPQVRVCPPFSSSRFSEHGNKRGVTGVATRASLSLNSRRTSTMFTHEY